MPGRTCVRPGPPGITRGFPRLSPCGGQVGHVLLSRSPLASSRGKVPFDLHVLGAPPAFILSQDRTLRPRAPRGLRAGGPSGRLTPIGFHPNWAMSWKTGTNLLSPCTGSSASLNIPWRWLPPPPPPSAHRIFGAPRGIRFPRYAPSRLPAARQGDILPESQLCGEVNSSHHILSTIN